MESEAERAAESHLSLILTSLASEPEETDPGDAEARARMGARLREHSKAELVALFEILRAAGDLDRPGATLRALVGRLAAVLGAARCSVLVAGPESRSARVVATHEPAGAEPITLDLSKYPEVRAALAEGRVVRVDDLQTDPLLADVRENLSALPGASILVMPVRAGDAVVGALFVRARKASRKFKDGEVRLVETAARLAGEALARAIGHEALSREARRTALEREVIRARYELLREYADLLENTSDGVFAVSPKGAVATVNRRALEITGYSRAELIGKPFARIVPEEALRAILAMRGREEPGELERYHIPIEDRRGERRSVSLTVQRLDTGERVVSMRDNTLEKRLEERLTAANDRLRRLAEMKNAFLAAATHEVKTPLGVALGYLKLLEGGSLGALADEQRAVLSDARECLEELSGVVADMLDLTKLEAGKMTIRLAEGDLAEAARAAARRFDAPAKAAGIALEVSAPDALPAVFDPARLGQVFANLLSNALKFTPRGGRVRVRVAEEGGAAWIEVGDTGPGIPEDRLEEAFEEFARIAPGDAEGSGLGLAIARRIVEAHGGAISAHRAPEGGALLRVRLGSPKVRRAA